MVSQKIKENIKLAAGIILGYAVLPAVICLGYHLTHGNIPGLRPSTQVECVAPSKLEVECSKVPTNGHAEVESQVYLR